ncbi:MAG: hypothetical protein LBO76_07495 [Treponema sp.]|jgi:hypothetical protein|nr:hypothetical protein [Treponema sp.]
MANKTKPSIYQDRGTIGSAKELDEYGVWVKSEPQILDSGGAEPSADLSLSDLDDLPDFSITDDSGAENAESAVGADVSISEDGFDSDFNLDDFDTDVESLNAGEGDDAGLLAEAPDSAADGYADDSAGQDAAEQGTDLSLDEIDLSLDDNSLSLDEGDLSLDDNGLSLDEGDLSLDDNDLSLDDKGLSLDESDLPPELGEEGQAPADEGEFTDISLEDLLEVADEVPGEQSPAEPEKPDRGQPASSGGSDMSTQLLMKIAGELSSIRQELSALKQEFSMSRGGLEPDHGETRGFFDDAGGDDKIALTGDELDNIINTADFTEETGADATAADPGDVSGESAPAEPPPEEEALGADADLGIPGEIGLPAEDPSGEILSEVSLDEALLSEAPLDALSPLDESALDESVLDESVLDESAGEAAEGSFTLVEEPGETGGEAAELPEISLDDAEDLLSLSPEMITEEGMETGAESAFPDISMDLPEDGGEISLDGFDEEALDLSNAVIDEPDLSAEIRENPPEEPLEILEEPLETLDTFETLETLETLEEPLEIAGEGETPAAGDVGNNVDNIEDEAEISRAEESAAEIPAVRAGDSHGEDLEQIIPEGFLVEELDEEGGFGGAGLDTLDEGVTLDEIPEDILPEEDEGVPDAEIAEPAEAADPELPAGIPGNFKKELKQVLSYMDQLLESLPEEKIEEFAQSEYFDTYKKLFKELGLA